METDEDRAVRYGVYRLSAVGAVLVLVSVVFGQDPDLNWSVRGVVSVGVFLVACGLRVARKRWGERPFSASEDLGTRIVLTFLAVLVGMWAVDGTHGWTRFWVLVPVAVGAVLAAVWRSRRDRESRQGGLW